MAQRQRGKKRLEAGNVLRDMVMDKFQKSKAAWAPEFRRMLTCTRLMRGMPYGEADEEDMPDLTYPVVPAIAKSINAVILDIFGSSRNAPFSLEPDPIPELPADVTEWVEGLVQQNIPALEQVTGGDPNKVPQALAGLRKTILQELNDKASDAADNLTNVVKTRLQEGDWNNEFSNFLTNLVCYPIAIMKGPFIRTKRVRRWDSISNLLTFQDNDVWVVENVNPFSFFPSPYAKNINDCEYVIELRRTTALEFALLARTEGYDPIAIQNTQKDFPNGTTQNFYTGDDRDPDHDIYQSGLTEDIKVSGYYDIICFYGRVSGAILNSIGDFDLNEWEWYEAEVEVCGDEVIRAALNPRPDGRRPFSVQSMEPIPGSLYGECVPTRLLDVQRACESSIRNLLRNLTYSTKPFAEVNMDKLAEDEDPYIIDMFAVKQTKSGILGDNGPAYRFNNAPNHTAAIIAVFDKFLALGYEILGFPKVALGGMPDPSLGRTSGGMSMVLNQASKPLKKIVSDIGDNVITPVVQSFVDIELSVSTDPSIRGDIHVHPKGIEGLADDEAKAQRIQMALQNIAGIGPMMVQPGPLQGLVMNLFYKWMTLEGIPTQGLPDLNVDNAFAQDTGAAYSPAAGVSPGQPNNPAPPQQGLDGRSQPAMDAIQQSNNMSSTMGGR